MKAKLILTLLALIPATALSQTYYMKIHKSDGSTVSYDITDIYKITFNLTGVNNDDLGKLNSVLKPFLLMQNYPNPFNPNTTIQYQLPKAGKVELKIYNIAGQVVKTLVNESQKEGAYKVRWDGKNDQSQRVANGTYIYQIKHDNKALAKKMIFVK